MNRIIFYTFIFGCLVINTLAGPMRNDTRIYSRYPYNMIHQPAHLLHPRMPDRNMNGMRSGSRRNYDYILGSQNSNAIAQDETEDNEEEEEYEGVDEADLFEEIIDNEGVNVLHFNKINDPGRYFIEEGERDDEVDVTDDEDDMDDVTNDSDSCVDGNIEYRIGDEYTSPTDACSLCTCTRAGPRCTAEVCPPPPEGCIELYKRPNECCPVCMRKGCPFGNQIYPIGSKFLYTDCDMCECKQNGLVDCAVADCAPPKCVDARHIPGECCPVCPSDENCYGAGGEIIPAGRWVAMTSDRCIICKCRTAVQGSSYWYGHRQAQCKRDPRCRRAGRRTGR